MVVNDSVALALAAGGARGAYQAGAMFFLAEKGVKFDAVSGTSIGSLNAAYYAQGDGSVEHIQHLVELWYSISKHGVIQFSKETIISQLRQGQFGILDQEPVARLLDKWLDYEQICHSSTKLTIAVLPETMPLLDIMTGPWRKAHYVHAHKLGSAKLKQALLAATAIPMAFPSQKIDGEQQYADAAFADELPAQVLYTQGVRKIVSIFLSDRTLQNRVDFPGCSLLQIRPSLNIDLGLSSVFNFSQQAIKELISLGYEDAKTYYNEVEKIIQGIKNTHIKGNNIEELAKKLPNRHEPKLYLFA